MENSFSSNCLGMLTLYGLASHAPTSLPSTNDAVVQVMSAEEVMSAINPSLSYQLSSDGEISITCSPQIFLSPDGNWEGDEEDCAYNLRRQRGEVRVRIAHIEEDFVASDATLRTAVETAAEYWNSKMESIDPSIQFVVDAEAINVDCENLNASEVPEGEVIICIPSSHFWQQPRVVDNKRYDGIETFLGYTNFEPLIQFNTNHLEFTTGGAVVRLNTEKLLEITARATYDAIPDQILPQIVTHELGHILGLGHDIGKVKGNIMSKMAVWVDIVNGTAVPYPTDEEGIVEQLISIYSAV